LASNLQASEALKVGDGLLNVMVTGSRHREVVKLVEVVLIICQKRKIKRIKKKERQREGKKERKIERKKIEKLCSFANGFCL